MDTPMFPYVFRYRMECSPIYVLAVASFTQQPCDGDPVAPKAHTEKLQVLLQNSQSY